MGAVLQLVIEDFEGAKTVVPLGEGEVTIGRQEGNTIQLTEKNVSRSHARLRPVDDGWELEDLQSYNGVRLNGDLIEAASVLHAGDLIQIGDYQLTLGAGALNATVDIGPGGAPLIAANEALDVATPSRAAREELDPAMLRPPPLAAPVAVPAPVTDAHDVAPAKKGGGLIVGLLLAGGAAGLFFWQSQAANGAGGPGDEAVAASADASQPDDPTADPTGVPAGSSSAPEDDGATAEAAADEATGDGELEAIDGDDGGSGDVEDADAGEAAESDGELVEDATGTDAEVADPDPPPTPAVAKKKKKKKKSATQLLADARKAQLAGRYSNAYSLAKRAYGAKASQEAAQVMGVAACKMGDANKAKGALAKLSGGKKSALKSVCAGAGITL